MPATIADAAEALRSSFRIPKDPVKRYVFARMYGASDRTARRTIESLGFDRRKTGRIIRVGRRAWARMRPVGPGYRTYDQQKALYERWKAQGRGAVAVPQTDPQRGSHHTMGLAIDLGVSDVEARRIVDRYFTAYPRLMPLRTDRSIVHIIGSVS